MISLTAHIMNKLVIANDLSHWPTKFATMPKSGAPAFCHSCTVNNVEIRYFSTEPRSAEDITKVDLGLDLLYLLLCHNINARLSGTPASVHVDSSGEIALFVNDGQHQYQVHFLMHNTHADISFKIRHSLFNRSRPLLMFYRGSLADTSADSFSGEHTTLHWSTTSESFETLVAYIEGKIKRFSVRDAAKNVAFRPVFLRTTCSCCNERYLVPVALTLLLNRLVPTMQPISFHVAFCRRSYVAKYLSLFDAALKQEAARYGYSMAELSGPQQSESGEFIRTTRCPSCHGDIKAPIQPPAGVSLKRCPAAIAPFTVDASMILPDSVVWSGERCEIENTFTTLDWKRLFVGPLCGANAELPLHQTTELPPQATSAAFKQACAKAQGVRSESGPTGQACFNLAK